MDIPQEWMERPYWQTPHYCAICLEAMPLICHVCRKDIEEQQEAVQKRIAEDAAEEAAALDAAQQEAHQQPIEYHPHADEEAQNEASEEEQPDNNDGISNADANEEAPVAFFNDEAGGVNVWMEVD